MRVAVQKEAKEGSGRHPLVGLPSAAGEGAQISDHSDGSQTKRTSPIGNAHHAQWNAQ